MIELTGKYTTGKIFTDEVEETALTQVQQMLDHPAFQGTNPRFMPDIHAGKGSVIGTTFTIGDKVIPNVVGVDIGCGVTGSFILGEGLEDLEKLDTIIHNLIPAGRNVHHKPITYDMGNLKGRIINVCNRIGIDHKYVLRSLGTLGGGNHFIELGKAPLGGYLLTVHSGSRNFGLKVAEFYQNKAKEYCARNNINVPGGMEYLEGQDKRAYLCDMRVAQHFAWDNRRAILQTIKDSLKLTLYKRLNSTHNYIDNYDVCRKGAISAKKYEEVLIPLNMRDGIIHGAGKGSTDWNQSAPHGAGRVMSRGKAKRELDLEQFKDDMKGIYTTSVGPHTIDESPRVYKKASDIEENMKDSVLVFTKYFPVYNFKA